MPAFIALAAGAVAALSLAAQWGLPGNVFVSAPPPAGFLTEQRVAQEGAVSQSVDDALQGWEDAAAVAAASPTNSLSPEDATEILSGRVLGVQVAGGDAQAPLTMGFLSQFSQFLRSFDAYVASPLASGATAYPRYGGYLPQSDGTTALASPAISGGTISNAVSGAFDALSAGTLALSGALTGTDATFSGTLSAGTLNVAGVSSGGAITAPYFTATSTTASQLPYASSTVLTVSGTLFNSNVNGANTVTWLQHDPTISGTIGTGVGNVGGYKFGAIYGPAAWSNGPGGETNYIDDTWHLGVNVGTLSGGVGRADTSKPNFALSWESKFYDGSVFGQEFHLQGVQANGSTTFRPLSFFAAHDNSKIGAAITADYLSINSKDGAQMVKFDFQSGSKNINVNASTKFVFGNNNAVVATQKNAAGNAFLNLPYIDAGDVLAVSQPIHITSSRAGAGATYPGIFAVFQPTSANSDDTVLYLPGPAVTGNLNGVIARTSATGVFQQEFNNQGSGDSQVYVAVEGAGDPKLKFDVVSGGGGKFTLGIDNSDSDTFKISTGAALGSGDVFAVNSSGNVGIGTTTPGALLSANGNILGNGTLALTGTTGSTTIATGQGFTIGGSQFVVQQGSGNVGIGTTNPSRALEVSSASGYPVARFATPSGVGSIEILANNNSYSTINFGDAAGTTNLGQIFYTNPAYPGGGNNMLFNTNSSEKMRISSAGNVGIGTTTPDGKLTVNVGSTQTVYFASPSHLYTKLERGAAGQNNLLTFNTAGTFNWNVGLGDDLNNNLYFTTNTGAPSLGAKMTLTTAGNVGIGTTSPSLGKLTIDSNGNSVLGLRVVQTSNTNLPSAIIYGDNYGLSVDANDTSSSYYALNVRTGGNSLGSGGTSRLYVRNDGNVGIGTTTPQNMLSVYNQSGNAFIDINSPASQTGVAFQRNGANMFRIFNQPTGGTNYLAIQSYTAGAGIALDTSGNVGIGTSTPTAQLSTTGTVRFSNFGAGTLTTDASGNLSVSSDERLKNIDGVFNRGLADIVKLSPIQYHWNATSGLDTSTQYAGFSAQNVQTAIPEAVGSSTSGYLTLQDRPLIAAAINAIKEIASITGTFKTNLIAWLGDATNGIGKLVAHEIHGDMLCAGNVCVNEQQLAALLSASGSSYTITTSNQPAPPLPEPDNDTSATTTPPSVEQPATSTPSTDIGTSPPQSGDAPSSESSGPFNPPEPANDNPPPTDSADGPAAPTAQDDAR